MGTIQVPVQPAYQHLLGENKRGEATKHKVVLVVKNEGKTLAKRVGNQIRIYLNDLQLDEGGK